MSELNFDLALTQQFLDDLARNNSLDWMHAHQTEYKLARKQFEDLARAVNEQLAMNNPRRLDIDIARRISRLNRDTRFSNDKSPYNPAFRDSSLPLGTSADSVRFVPCADTGYPDRGGRFVCFSVCGSDRAGPPGDCRSG